MISLPTENSTSTTSTTAPPDQRPIQGYLHEIKSLLEQQTRTMDAQNEKIARLTAEVDELKMTVGRGKDERIRELERELGALRG